jgi:hypothetical protein
MPNLNDFIRHANVLSRTYYLPMDKAQTAIEDFLRLVAGNTQQDVASLPFYSIEDLGNGNVRMKIHMAMRGVQRDLPPQLKYDSYFYIPNMASVAVHGDFAAVTEEAALSLQEHIEANGLRPATPLFCEMKGDDTLQFTILKMGYALKEQ